MRYVKRFSRFGKRQTVVGLLIFCKKTERILLIQRSDGNNYWSMLTGGADATDSGDLETMKRELGEELRFFDMKSITNIQKIGEESTQRRVVKFYLGEIEKEFNPILDEENLNWGWFHPEGASIVNGSINSFGLPENLYPRLMEKIKKVYDIKMG